MSNNALRCTKAAWFGALLLISSSLAWADQAKGGADGAFAPALVRQAELLNLIRQDCGSCHGLTLAGGLGVPLLPAALQGKDPEGLKYTILSGRPGTPMPGWQPFLTEAEAEWMVRILMKGLPDAH